MFGNELGKGDEQQSRRESSVQQSCFGKFDFILIFGLTRIATGQPLVP